jgi:hypothetical protein
MQNLGKDWQMEQKSTKTHSVLLRYIRLAYWAFAILLLLVVLAGCLTSYAAGPPEKEQISTPSATFPLPTPTPTASPTIKAGITLVPNLVVRPFQALTPTATATVTPTVIPDTPTPTAEPTATATGTPTATATAAPTDTPSPTAILATPVAFQAYAWVDNYFPAPGSFVTVHGRLLRYGRPVNGANMGATWRYTHTEDYCSAYTNIEGRATCARNIGYPLEGYWVYVDVVFVYQDEKYYAKTGFLVDP